MKFADCEKSARELRDGKTYTDIASLDMFIPFAPNDENPIRSFIFDEYEIVLKGITEDFKVYFIEHTQEGPWERLIGEIVFDRTYIKNDVAYTDMILAIKAHYITF